MTLFFYKSALCPRCYIAGKFLQEVAAKNPQIQIKSIDIFSAPRRACQDNIRMIPTITIEGKQLIMLWPTKKAITDFLSENGYINKDGGKK